MNSSRLVPLVVEPPFKMIFARLKTRAADLPAADREKFEKIIREAFALCRFAGCWREIDRARAADLASGSADIAKLLENCGSAAIFGVTAGTDIVEAARREYAAGAAARAAVFDAVGSESVEEAADQLELYLRRHFARGGRGLTGRRFSPGYGDWKLEAQRGFFRLLDMEALGVRLSDDLIMRPEKSITAIIGVN